MTPAAPRKTRLIGILSWRVCGRCVYCMYSSVVLAVHSHGEARGSPEQHIRAADGVQWAREASERAVAVAHRRRFGCAASAFAAVRHIPRRIEPCERLAFFFLRKGYVFSGVKCSPTMDGTYRVQQHRFLLHRRDA